MKILGDSNNPPLKGLIEHPPFIGDTPIAGFVGEIEHPPCLGQMGGGPCKGL